ncbi:P-loop containing nucleoside triphosphate hydrolase protein [Polychytrium aggregatum]|uniref:P-loop containing nucleoside triphosphate hydrolase protein n=1 Tax=Polychytrium aggregatum TaxID=110093 RepID=UPI0022FE860B|nr:P-loop containing nucleoside triphosphate hydrolase protein [Polychytrium aggregatum]KAI9209129.1 P-loop containing nucleoside triphosphate hydrolase protein [Polychytrium aggregatum]
MPERSIATLDLPAAVRTRLLRAGFRSKHHLVSLSAAQLAKETGISLDESTRILQRLQPPFDLDAAAKSIQPSSLASRSARAAISTSSVDLDRILRGGIPVGQVTEISGSFGIGKTQIGMQLCVNARIPVECGGPGGEAVYIDTEGSFAPERIADMVLHTTEQLQRQYSLPAHRLSLQTFLSGIHIFRAHDSDRQLEILQHLDQFCADRNVSLVVLDSVAYHFRQGSTDTRHRSRMLHLMSQSMMRTANKHHLAIVAMNQVTTAISPNDPERTTLVPSLGESWTHLVTNRIIVAWRGGQRMATVAKSPFLDRASGWFDVKVPQPVLLLLPILHLARAPAKH